MSEQVVKRQRKFSPKVKTGCRTCKARRIKCDENHPACQQCVTSGRLCGGYDFFCIATPASLPNGIVRIDWMRPSSYPPGDSHKERSAFDFFRRHVMEDLPGVFDSKLWHGYVLPVSMTEASVRHAVIALGAMQSPGEGISEPKANHFAFQQYSKAMKALNVVISNPKRATVDLVLITCLLFVAFEFQQGAWEQASVHLSGGLNIAKGLSDSRKGSTPPSEQAMDRLVATFERLDIQMSLFTSDRVKLNQDLNDAMATSIPVQTTFKDVVGASRSLNVNMAAMRELVHTIEAHRFSPGGISEEAHTHFQAQITRQLVSLDRWNQSMENLLPSLSCPRSRRAANTLRTHQICCKLMVSAGLTTGCEMLWDSFSRDFERIVETAEGVLVAQTSPDRDHERARLHFSLDMGVIPPLYFTAIKCREPLLRRRAIALLNRCRHQEGVWNGQQSAIMAEQIMKLEERGLGQVQSASEVPEENRLYQAYYDIRRSSHVLYCKQRCFQSDGRWLEYEEHVM